jgi:hypothetical protein
LEIFKKLHATNNSSSMRRVGRLDGDNVVKVGSLVRDNVEGTITLVGNDSGAGLGDGSVGAVPGQLVLPV